MSTSLEISAVRRPLRRGHTIVNCRFPPSEITWVPLMLRLRALCGGGQSLVGRGFRLMCSESPAAGSETKPLAAEGGARRVNATKKFTMPKSQARPPLPSLPPTISHFGGLPVNPPLHVGHEVQEIVPCPESTTQPIAMVRLRLPVVHVHSPGGARLVAARSSRRGHNRHGGCCKASKEVVTPPPKSSARRLGSCAPTGGSSHA